MVRGAPQLSEAQRERLDNQLTAALKAQQRIEQQSRRLTQGKTLPHCKIVNAYDATIAPICKGKSNCPAQFGRKPGIIAEPAAGFIFGLHLPVGNPSDASYVQPLIDKVQQAIARIGRIQHPAIHSLAGDLAFNDASLREALHAARDSHRGDPAHGRSPASIACSGGRPSNPGARRACTGIQTPCQVQLAYASGYSRPVIESIIASLLCRGAGRLTYKGHRGAIVQTGMAVMAHNAATWSASTSIVCRSGHACSADDCA